MLNNAEVYNELGSTLKELGRYEEAVDNLKNLLGLHQTMLRPIIIKVPFCKNLDSWKTQ